MLRRGEEDSWHVPQPADVTDCPNQYIDVMSIERALYVLANSLH